MQSVPPIPHEDDRCASCGAVIAPDPEAVLVPDEVGGARWWHLRCRDAMLLRLSEEEPGGRGSGPC